jgi:hypothetical protein
MGVCDPLLPRSCKRASHFSVPPALASLLGSSSSERGCRHQRGLKYLITTIMIPQTLCTYEHSARRQVHSTIDRAAVLGKTLPLVSYLSSSSHLTTQAHSHKPATTIISLAWDHQRAHSLSFLECHPPLGRLELSLSHPVRRRRRPIWLSLRFDRVQTVT